LLNIAEGATFEPLISKRLGPDFLHWEDDPKRCLLPVTCGEPEKERETFLCAYLEETERRPLVVSAEQDTWPPRWELMRWDATAHELSMAVLMRARFKETKYVSRFDLLGGWLGPDLNRSVGPYIYIQEGVPPSSYLALAFLALATSAFLVIAKNHALGRGKRKRDCAPFLCRLPTSPWLRS
jgi:hypothetical protein